MSRLRMPRGFRGACMGPGSSLRVFPSPDCHGVRGTRCNGGASLRGGRRRHARRRRVSPWRCGAFRSDDSGRGKAIRSRCALHVRPACGAASRCGVVGKRGAMSEGAAVIDRRAACSRELPGSLRVERRRGTAASFSRCGVGNTDPAVRLSTYRCSRNGGPASPLGVRAAGGGRGGTALAATRGVLTWTFREETTWPTIQPRPDS